MPELPEVETVCRVMRGALVDHRIVEVEAATDEIVFKKRDPEEIEHALIDRTVRAVHRKGKYYWLQLDKGPMLAGHLGMAGWIREVGRPTTRLMEHGKGPLDDDQGRPKFLKLFLTTEEGRRIAFTDGRRLSRIWLSDDPAKEPPISLLGPDVMNEPRTAAELLTALKGRTAPIKALLLDQSLFAGVGNWIADEVLYQARIAPARPAGELKKAELTRMVDRMAEILVQAVELDADYDRYPTSWLFTHRWGGKRGKAEIEGKAIRRDTIGGRTTAWVPSLQK